MAQHPFLKSIRPVNLLSFGPNTQEIELKPLNILIGPNGSGKSNLIEIVGLLSNLGDKDPWSDIVETGGASQWIWKGANPEARETSLTVVASGEKFPRAAGAMDPNDWVEKPEFYFIALGSGRVGSEDANKFEVIREEFKHLDRWENDELQLAWFFRTGWHCEIKGNQELDTNSRFSSLSPSRPILSFLGIESDVGLRVPHIIEFAKTIQSLALYRDWEFGVNANPRDPQPIGLESARLDEDMRNMAQVLKAWRDRGDQASFHRLVELTAMFYEPVVDVDVELIASYLLVSVKESTGITTPATRLSDGTLRWLALTTILLNPAPPPVTCLEEPELGLHPDIIPTLADLLREASTRTQLIVTTHSQTLIECFSDTPESVCVCEKSGGATRIRRLDRDRLSSWLEDYSLGQLWAKGEIGGNRW